MTDLKIVAMRGMNAVVVLGTVIFAIAGIAGAIADNEPSAALVGAALIVGLYAICAAINYVFFGKATVWNKVDIEAS